MNEWNANGAPWWFVFVCDLFDSVRCCVCLCVQCACGRPISFAKKWALLFFFLYRCVHFNFICVLHNEKAPIEDYLLPTGDSLHSIFYMLHGPNHCCCCISLLLLRCTRIINAKQQKSIHFEQWLILGLVFPSIIIFAINMKMICNFRVYARAWSQAIVGIRVRPKPIEIRTKWKKVQVKPENSKKWNIIRLKWRWISKLNSFDSTFWFMSCYSREQALLILRISTVIATEADSLSCPVLCSRLRLTRARNKSSWML